MPQNYGISTPEPHQQKPRHPPARYLVLIDSGSGRLACMYLQDHTQVAEFDAGAEEVALMTHGVAPARTATGADWNEALKGHSNEERAGAEVYELQL